MLDVAIRKPDGSTTIDWQHVGVRSTPPLPVAPALETLLPDGLRRGSTVSVGSSTSVGGAMSLLFALLGAASADGAWCALVGFPPVSAEALRGYGIELRRLALVPVGDPTGWVTAVGALLDALDVVAVRPPRGRGLVPGDVRRLAARARSKDAVLMPFVAGSAPGQGRDGSGWPNADVRLQVQASTWEGAADGGGRLRARRVEVNAGGRGPAARPRTAQLWLPGPDGAVSAVAPLAAVVDLAG